LAGVQCGKDIGKKSQTQPEGIRILKKELWEKEPEDSLIPNRRKKKKDRLEECAHLEGFLKKETVGKTRLNPMLREQRVPFWIK